MTTRDAKCLPIAFFVGQHGEWPRFFQVDHPGKLSQKLTIVADAQNLYIYDIPSLHHLSPLPQALVPLKVITHHTIVGLGKTLQLAKDEYSPIQLFRDSNEQGKTEWKWAISSRSAYDCNRKANTKSRQGNIYDELSRLPVFILDARGQLERKYSVLKQGSSILVQNYRHTRTGTQIDSHIITLPEKVLASDIHMLSNGQMILVHYQKFRLFGDMSSTPSDNFLLLKDPHYYIMGPQGNIQGSLQEKPPQLSREAAASTELSSIDSYVFSEPIWQAAETLTDESLGSIRNLLEGMTPQIQALPQFSASFYHNLRLNLRNIKFTPTTAQDLWLLGSIPPYLWVQLSLESVQKLQLQQPQTLEQALRVWDQIAPFVEHITFEESNSAQQERLLQIILFLHTMAQKNPGQLNSSAFSILKQKRPDFYGLTGLHLIAITPLAQNLPQELRAFQQLFFPTANIEQGYSLKNDRSNSFPETDLSWLLLASGDATSRQKIQSQGLTGLKDAMNSFQQDHLHPLQSFIAQITEGQSGADSHNIFLRELAQNSVDASAPQGIRKELDVSVIESTIDGNAALTIGMRDYAGIESIENIVRFLLTPDDSSKGFFTVFEGADYVRITTGVDGDLQRILLRVDRSQDTPRIIIQNWEQIVDYDFDRGTLIERINLYSSPAERQQKKLLFHGAVKTYLEAFLPETIAIRYQQANSQFSSPFKVQWEGMPLYIHVQELGGDASRYQHINNVYRTLATVSVILNVKTYQLRIRKHTSPQDSDTTIFTVGGSFLAFSQDPLGKNLLETLPPGVQKVLNNYGPFSIDLPHDIQDLLVSTRTSIKKNTKPLFKMPSSQAYCMQGLIITSSIVTPDTLRSLTSLGNTMQH